MKVNGVTLGSYLQAVNKKIDDPKTSRMLQFGTVNPIGGQTRLRDDAGLQMTKTTILQSAQNLHSVTEGRDEFAKKMHNFSAATPSTGYEMVTDVVTIGAIDVTIATLSTSLIPLLAVDRPMSTPVDTIWYNNLIALNDQGGVKAGDVVSGNFNAPNPNVDLGPGFTGKITIAKGQEKSSTWTTNYKVIPGTVEVTIGTVVGKDFAADGTIYFADGSKGSVNYDNGSLKITSNVEGATEAAVAYKKDIAADDTGASVLQVTNDYVPVQLVADPKNIVVKDNIVNRAYMAKAQLLEAAGAKTINQADLLFARTKDTYTDYLNRVVLNEFIKGVSADSVKINLSTYSATQYAQTKNDMILQFVTNLQAVFLARTGLRPTAIVTGTYGVALLSCVPSVWTPNTEAAAGINALAGYFNGIAVYRHNMMDYKTSANTAQFYIAVKLADNSSGSVAYGEFLPLTNTGVVSNFNMPQNISAGYFCWSGAKKIAGHLVLRGTVILPVGETEGKVGLFGRNITDADVPNYKNAPAH